MARRQLPRQSETPAPSGFRSRIAQLINRISFEPAGVLERARGLLVAVWRRRGGGFYGLGYIVAFLLLEAQLLAGDLAESSGTSEFIVAQLLEWLFRFGFLSFLVALKALLWPLYVLDLFGGIGIIALVVGYFGFERLVRPAVERVLPELREDRERRESGKQRPGAPGQSENESPSSSEHNP